MFLRFINSIIELTFTKFNLTYLSNTFLSITSDLSLESNGDCLVITVNM